MEYLEDLNTGRALLPADPKLRAYSRLWCDHINRHIIPAFYKYLQAQEADNQVKFAGELKGHISTLVDAADTDGPFFLGEEMTFVDVQLAPWLVRLEKVLKPYRGKTTHTYPFGQTWLLISRGYTGWPDAEPGSRWEKWVKVCSNAFGLIDISPY